MIPNAVTIGKVEVINITINIRADKHSNLLIFTTEPVPSIRVKEYE